MHADLELNQPLVFTNPAAVLGGTSSLLLAADFGDATVRVATLSFSTGAWSVANEAVSRVGGAVKIELPADVNKVSVTLLGVTAQQGAPFPPVVGLDVLA